jgi:site-specific DNA-methyltransferase (adenine-specific)
MRPAEWRALLQDIRERGILEPLRVAEDGLTLLDGRHRLVAARELGLPEVPVAPAACGPGGEAAYALKSALHRRHLSDDQRAMLGAKLAELLGAERRQESARTAAKARWGDASGIGVVPDASLPDPSRTIAAKTLGVSERRLRSAQALAEDAPDLAARVEAGGLALRAAKGWVERRAALAELAAAPAAVLPTGGAELWEGDAFDLAARLSAGSVDLVMTDPPYSHDWLAFWPQLGELAARVLRPGGFLVAYVGHMFLPAELEGLASGGLEWWWAAALTFHGHHPAIRARRVRTRWRPVAILRQPGGREAPWFSDLFSTDPLPQKGLHPWQQSLGPARALVRHFSLPGALVLDPFAGAGTFPVAAILEGRRALAMELDPEHAATARARIAAAVVERDGQAQVSA